MTTLRPISDGPPYEPRDYTGVASLDSNIRNAFIVLGNLVARSNLDDDDKARLPAYVLGCIHNLTLEVNKLRAEQVTVIQQCQR